MDQVNPVPNNTASLILDDSPSLDWVLARASKIFPKEGDISKTSLVFYQSPANFYAGSAVTQSGDGLSRAGRTRESSVCMRDVAAPGMLKFLSHDKGQELHKDLTHDMMGRTTLHDTRKKFYMEDASHTYRKYKDIRDKCVIYNKDWERVKPESGIFQTEQEMSDVLQALVEAIWEREEEEHGRKKRVDVDSPRAADAAPTPSSNHVAPVDVTSHTHNGYGEDLGPVLTHGMSPAVTPNRERKEEAVYAKSMPCNWLPQYFLSWIFWGPLSSNPDPRISTSTSADPPKPASKKGEGSQASGTVSRVHSAENFKLKDPSSAAPEGASGAALPMSRKKARQLKRKEREEKDKPEVLSPRASLAEAIAKSTAQQAEVVAMLGRLNSALTQSLEIDRRRQEMDLLKEQIAVAEEDGDGEEAQKLRAKRRRLMREPHAAAGGGASAFPGAGAGGANGGVMSHLPDPVLLASRVQAAVTAAAVGGGGGSATMGWENPLGLVSAEGAGAVSGGMGEAAGGGVGAAGGGAVGGAPESAEAWRLR